MKPHNLCTYIVIVFTLFLSYSNQTMASSDAEELDQQLTDEKFLSRVVQHLYRWYMDEIDVIEATRDPEKPFVVWVREYHPELDEGDKSQFAEVVLLTPGISVHLKKADYSIEELDIHVENDIYKINRVGRIDPTSVGSDNYTKVNLGREEMREYLFRMRSEAQFPDEELLTRLRLAVRDELKQQFADQISSVSSETQTVHLSPISNVANEIWVFWETGRTLIRFASDIDLSNPDVWEHEELAVDLYDLDEAVVVSLEEVAGSNAYMTRDQAGRALYNCVVLGKKLELVGMDR